MRDPGGGLGVLRRFWGHSSEGLGTLEGGLGEPLGGLGVPRGATGVSQGAGVHKGALGELERGSLGSRGV